jgi:hypothetical protein
MILLRTLGIKIGLSREVPYIPQAQEIAHPWALRHPEYIKGNVGRKGFRAL